MLGQLGQPVQEVLAMGFAALVPTDGGVVGGRGFYGLVVNDGRGIGGSGSANRGDEGGKERDSKEGKVHGGDGG